MQHRIFRDNTTTKFNFSLKLKVLSHKIILQTASERRLSQQTVTTINEENLNSHERGTYTNKESRNSIERNTQKDVNNNSLIAPIELFDQFTCDEERHLCLNIRSKQSEMIDLYVHWIQQKYAPAPRQVRNNNQQPQARITNNRKKSRRSEYKEAPILFAKDKGSSPRESSTTSTSSNSMEEHYRGIFSEESLEENTTIMDRIEDINLSQPITLEEIIDCIKKTKCTAPGVERMTMKQVAKIPKSKLLLLYNSICF